METPALRSSSIRKADGAEIALTLSNKIDQHTASIGIVGLGYTGLPLAIAFAKTGLTVTGIDIDAGRVQSVNSGCSYLEDISDADIESALSSGLLHATADASLIADLDVVSICVPTPLTKSKEPDLSYVINATKSVAQHLRPGHLIILESTTYPGTTHEVVRPILEETGLRVGEDFFLGYSPERVDPGNPKYSIKNTPKIVAGETDECVRHVEALYEQVVDKVVVTSSTGAAELAKLFENIFRNVNIALVNELAQICDRLNLDVWEVIEAAATKPFGFMKFLPGPGLGGHCIPVDPFYLAWKTRQHNMNTEFIELAGKINQNMPFYIVSKIADALNDRKKSLNSARILLIGAAYKRDIADVRESPIFELIELLEAKKAEVVFHDPHVPAIELSGQLRESVALDERELRRADCVVVVTNHSVLDYDLLAAKSALIVDTRNALAKQQGENIFRI